MKYTITTNSTAAEAVAEGWDEEQFVLEIVRAEYCRSGGAGSDCSDLIPYECWDCESGSHRAGARVCWDCGATIKA